MLAKGCPLVLEEEANTANASVLLYTNDAMNTSIDTVSGARRKHWGLKGLKCRMPSPERLQNPAG